MKADRLANVAPRGSMDLLLASAGWRVLVPGLPHYHWGQHDQAVIFFGFHFAATAIGLFAWGTWLSLLMLSFAFAAHAVSAADAIKQASFPKFQPMVPLLTALVGLGAVCYAPLMIVGSMFAWPVVADDRPREGYWVNRWAYRGALGPRHGETIWLRATHRVRPRLARVLASEGQRVRWSENQLHVDDRPSALNLLDLSGYSHALDLIVPDRHVIVSFHDDLTEPHADTASWEIIAHDDIHGRAWARSYPVWDRQFLR